MLTKKLVILRLREETKKKVGKKDFPEVLPKTPQFISSRRQQVKLRAHVLLFPCQLIAQGPSVSKEKGGMSRVHELPVHKDFKKSLRKKDQAPALSYCNKDEQKTYLKKEKKA